jgi:lipopolysaccharide export system permease protein
VNTFDRHLLREWLYTFGLALAAMCGLLLLHVLYDDFRELRDWGARGWVLWKYVGITLPGFLAIILPLSLLMSLLYALGTLHRANELTAMRAAGVGFLRLTAPIWLVGVLCCGLTWWLNTTIVPASVENARTMRDALRFQSDSKKELPPDRIGAAFSVGFDNQLARRMWFFNRYSRFTQRGYGVSVSEQDPQRREVRRILAQEAWFDPVRQGWHFKACRELTFAPDTGELLGSQFFEARFAGNYREKPDLMLLIDQKPSNLSLFQLRALLDHLEAEASPKVARYAIRYYGLIADTLGPLIVIAIAIPFAVAGVRVNPAVGVSKSIGLFFLYYLFSNFAASLAVKQIVEPQVAAWLPNLGIAALAVWLFVRLR